MSNRYTPYGYNLTNGNTVVCAEEADVIRRIFSDYICGKSLKSIAEDLTAQGIEYLPGQTVWNKNRVARVIENRKYLGEQLYPRIIGQTLFDQAQEIKRGKKPEMEEGYGEAITPAVTEIRCGCCGSSVERITDKRLRCSQKFLCLNETCKHAFEISDEMMRGMLYDMLSRVTIKHQIQTSAKDFLNVRRMENDVERLFDMPGADANEIRRLIFEIAAEKYRLMTVGYETDEKLRTDLAPANLSSSNIRQTVMKTVSQIRLLDSQSIELTLINGQIIGKEQPDGSREDAENCAHDPTDITAGGTESIA